MSQVTDLSSSQAVPANPSKPQKRRARKMMHLALFVVGGGSLGYAYYRFIGCASGTCPITSNPYISTIYGAVMGYMMSGGIK